MGEVRLRAAAAIDLAAILEYSAAQFGDAAAEAYLRSFERAFDLLCNHPNAGVTHPDIEPAVRCLSHRRHRIFYDVEGDTVWVVRILHHAMDERRWLRG